MCCFAWIRLKPINIAINHICIPWFFFGLLRCFTFAIDNLIYLWRGRQFFYRGWLILILCSVRELLSHVRLDFVLNLSYDKSTHTKLEDQFDQNLITLTMSLLSLKYQIRYFVSTIRYSSVRSYIVYLNESLVRHSLSSSFSIVKRVC